MAPCSQPWSRHAQMATKRNPKRRKECPPKSTLTDNYLESRFPLGEEPRCHLQAFRHKDHHLDKRQLEASAGFPVRKLGLKSLFFQ